MGKVWFIIGLIAGSYYIAINTTDIMIYNLKSAA